MVKIVNYRFERPTDIETYKYAEYIFDDPGKEHFYKEIRISLFIYFCSVYKKWRVWYTIKIFKSVYNIFKDSTDVAESKEEQKQTNLEKEKVILYN